MPPECGEFCWCLTCNLAYKGSLSAKTLSCQTHNCDPSKHVVNYGNGSHISIPENSKQG